LIKNFNLLRIVEKIENRKSVVPYQINANAEKDPNAISNKLSKSETSQANQEKTIINEQFTDQRCKKHNLSLYMYVPGTNMLLCDNCVKETNLKAYPLPSVEIVLMLAC
jgi:hypothetical protein